MVTSPPLLSGFYIGLMSGTSMDAVDAVLAEAGGGTFEIRNTFSVAIPPPLGARMRGLAIPGAAHDPTLDVLDQLGQLDHEVATLFASAATGLLAHSGVAATRVRAIGSHGQTVRHRPRGKHPFTLQIGDPNVIAVATGIPVVADFRRRDVALGGQGAPLVPAFHAAIFSSPAEYRVILNIGGIANVTRLPPDGAVTGLDTGPGNTLMDAWTRCHLGRPFDRDGAWAASGGVDPRLLAGLLAHPFLALPTPKSTGPEEFSLSWLQALLVSNPGLAPANVQATLCEFTALSIVAGIGEPWPTRMITCGGGAHNMQLTARLEALLPETRVESSAAHGVDPGFVEAAAFAWLAARTLAGLEGNLPSVTGARRAAVLGSIWPT